MGTTTQLTLDMLKVRTPHNGLVSVGEGDFGYIYADYLRNAGQRNIVWKRRQLGMTTFALARGFLKAAEGKTCLVVAYRSDGADYLWDMVQTFNANLSVPLPIKWKSNGRHRFGLEGCNPDQFEISNSLREAVGLGRMIDFVHLHEFAWWRRSDQERVWRALLPALSHNAEIIIESTPGDDNSGLFHDIWRNADAYGFTRHFFPWWRNPRLVAEAVDEKTLTKAEKELISAQGLTLGQIGWRRKQCGKFVEQFGSEEMFKAEYGEMTV
jgi:hypothetical protein